MKSRWIALAAVAVVAVAAATGTSVGIWVRPYIASCRRDAEITANEQRRIHLTAERFVSDMLSKSPHAAYQSMSKIGQAYVSASDFDALAHQLASEQSGGTATVVHTYMTSILPPPRDGTVIPCDASKDSALLRMGEQSEQAHVILSYPVTSGRRSYDVWMISENGDWRVAGFHSGLIEISGHSGEDFWTLAKQQRARGHTFNATLLYKAAAVTLDRGPYIQPAVWGKFKADYEQFSPAPELKGSGPYLWTLKGENFPIRSVSFLGMEGNKMVLIISQPSTIWAGDADADLRNHRLIDAFIAAHPDWEESIDAIVARAIGPDPSSSYGTVFEKGSGYVRRAPGS